MSRYLVTGAAGFIGFHVARRLLADGHQVIALDNLNDYYDVNLKQARLAELAHDDRFTFEQVNIADSDALQRQFSSDTFDAVVHLAAQAGVRHSITHPRDYVETNILGFLNILEGCRQQQSGHLVYASSSSVYGANTTMPCSVSQSADHPMSLYGATKKSNELMAHTYSHLYGLATTGLRFFTVYGPWGRPDMALFLFTRAILSGQPIQLFNEGNMRRSFTYIDDVVEPIIRVLDQPATSASDWDSDNPDPATSSAPYRVFNIGGGESVELLRFVEVLEQCLGREATRELLPMQPGDVQVSHADVTALEQAVGFRPQVRLEDGVARFCEWYQGYYPGS